MRREHKFVRLHGSPALEAFQDQRELIKESGKEPTHSREILVDEPYFIGDTDASYEGARGWGGCRENPR